jgi:hypothetical protein
VERAIDFEEDPERRFGDELAVAAFGTAGKVKPRSSDMVSFALPPEKSEEVRLGMSGPSGESRELARG